MANSLRDDAVSPDGFFGDGSVCAFTVDWRVDTTTNLGFQDECQLIEEDLDPPSESRLVQLWLNLEPRTDIKLPWGKQESSWISSASSYPRACFQTFATCAPDPARHCVLETCCHERGPYVLE
jgi:hypothetical protein